MSIESININLNKKLKIIFGRKTVFFILIALFLFQNSFAQRFTATADATQIPLNYTFDVTYSVENGSLQKFTPPNFAAAGFDASGPAQSTNVSVINGKGFKISFSYLLFKAKKTRRPGDSGSHSNG
jgi:hypothetical protein